MFRFKVENQTKENLAYSIKKEGVSGDLVPNTLYLCFGFYFALFIPGEAEEGEKIGTKKRFWLQS